MTQDGFANRYSFRTDDLSILNLTDENYTILNWLSILLMNRKFNLSSDIAAQDKDYLTSVFLPAYENQQTLLFCGNRFEDFPVFSVLKQLSVSIRSSLFYSV